MSNSEAAQLLGDCMTARGWEVTWEQPGSYSIVVPPAQKDAHDHDRNACLVEHRIGVQPAPPIDEDLAEEEYAAQARTRQCIVDAGYDPPELPSYQAYKDQLLTGGEVFSVYTEALLGNTELLASCPDPLDTWGHNGRYR